MSALNLESAQESIFYKLAGESYLNDVQVLLARKLVTKSEEERARVVATASAGKKPGAGVIVLQPEIRTRLPAVPGPQLGLVFPVRILEHPELNLLTGSTKKTAGALAIFILRALHKFTITKNIRLRAADNAADPVEVKGLVGYDTFFETEVNQDEAAKCEPVYLTYGGGNLTATCATSGAAIYYTTDGTFPYQGTIGGRATTAALYTVPVAVAAGKTVWACAYKANYLSGDVAELLT